MPKRAKTPQEKKALSLKKDCRPSYGQNDKAARRLVPLRKAQEHRRSRRRANQPLAVFDRLDESAADLAESSALHDVHRTGGWTKAPDVALGTYVSWGLESRIARVGDKARRREKSIRFSAWLDGQIRAARSAP